MADHDRTGWVGHPVAARVVHALSFVLPFAASLASAFLLASWLPAPPEFLSELLRLVAIVVASAIVIVATDRVTRRLIPLAALLELTLAFPGPAPSRPQTAHRTGSAGQLSLALDDAVRGDDRPAAEAAQALAALVAMVSMHDRFAAGHRARVRESLRLVDEALGSPEPAADPAVWSATLRDVGVLNADGAATDRAGRPSGVAITSAVMAAVLGIAASPTSAVAFEALAFGAPIPFIGGEPFTDDPAAPLPPRGAPDTDGAAPSPGPGGLIEFPTRVVAGQGVLLGSDTATATSTVAPSADTRPPLAADVGGSTPATTKPPGATTTSSTPASSVAPGATTTSTVAAAAATTVKPTATSSSTSSTTTSSTSTTTTSTTTTSTTTTSTTTTSTTTTSTTTTTVPPTSTSTTVPPDGLASPHVSLLGPSIGDTTSQPVLQLGLADLPAVELPNYDTDRDDLPGISVEASGEHLHSDDPRAVQRFRLPIGANTLIDGTPYARLWLAADEFSEEWVGAIVALYDCAGESCTKLAWGEQWFLGGDEFQKVTIELGWVERLVPAGHHLEFRIAARGDSAADLMVAFGTKRFPSEIVVEGSHCDDLARSGTTCGRRAT